MKPKEVKCHVGTSWAMVGRAKDLHLPSFEVLQRQTTNTPNIRKDTATNGPALLTIFNSNSKDLPWLDVG